VFGHKLHHDGERREDLLTREMGVTHQEKDQWKDLRREKGWVEQREVLTQE
jgi:hypothetical protein